jgi:hypothetical protein
MNLEEMLRPMQFKQNTFEFALDNALDNFSKDNPHHQPDIDDPMTPKVNAKFYDTSIANPMHGASSSLEDFPDYSDKVISDYRLQKMLGRDVPDPSIIDLDTSDDYVGFLKNTIKNVLSSESEFNIDLMEKRKNNI